MELHYMAYQIKLNLKKKPLTFEGSLIAFWGGGVVSITRPGILARADFIADLCLSCIFGIGGMGALGSTSSCCWYFLRLARFFGERPSLVVGTTGRDVGVTDTVVVGMSASSMALYCKSLSSFWGDRAKVALIARAVIIAFNILKQLKWMFLFLAIKLTLCEAINLLRQGIWLNASISSTYMFLLKW